MSRFLAHLKQLPIWSAALYSVLALAGCDSNAPIVTYSIPTEVPEEFKSENDRMLAAMLPYQDQVWFYKVTGPESAIAEIEDEFRSFIEAAKLTDAGEPDLSKLPDDWKLGGKKPMRFASVDVNTTNKQLDISISSLPIQENWDEFVAMNVNRWRGQVGLEPSNDKWADGEAIEIDAADGQSVWVDLVGKPGNLAAPMMPPMAGMQSSLPQAGAAEKPSTNPPAETNKKSPLTFEAPEGWREGRMSSMRLAAFNVGPEDAPAEITVIPAGGDLRGNIARWLGQIRPNGVEDEVVDKALENAKKIDVDGRASQRFLLTGTDPKTGTAIDATIVPLDDGFSMFIKMTGPAEIVTDQSDEIEAFLNSLKL